MDGHKLSGPTLEELRLRAVDQTSAPAAAAPGVSDLRHTVRWGMRLVLRGKYMILACMALVVVPTVLIVKQMTPRYTAEAKIVIEAPETNDLLADRALSMARMRLTDSVIQTEAELIESTMLAQRVVDKLNLAEDPEFNATLRTPKPFAALIGMLNPMSWIPDAWKPPQPAAESLSPTAREDLQRSRIVRSFLGRLTVTSQRRSHIIVVRFVSEDREKAALIANTVAETYVLDRLEASFDDARRVTSWLGERLEALRKDVVAAEDAVETYRAENDLRRRDERMATVTDQQLSEINSRLVIARADLAQKQARLAQIRTLDRNRGSVDTASDVLESPLIQRLREQEAQKARELSEAEKTYASRHPRIVGLRADLGQLRSNIANEINKIATSIVNDVEIGAAGVKTLERELESLRRQTTTAGAAEVRLRELERQAEASKSLYEAFLNRFKREAEVERMQRANARIVSPANVPGGASYPPSGSIIFVALLLSAVGGVALVFIVDRLDNALRSADEVEDLTGLPMIAMVPLQRGRTERAVEEILKSPRSALADSVRSLRTALEFGTRPAAGYLTLVTSSVPKEGKTFVSLCLATISSKVEGKVLLIDGDLHRPRLHAALGTDGSKGLANLLNGTATFAEAVQPNIGGAFDFLPAGQCDDVTDLVKPERMDALLADLKSRYTRIIIDSPPVLAVADTRILARMAHNVIYLVRWNATPRDAVRNGIKLLRMNGVTPFGIVLSQVNQNKHARYGYGDYGQYYGRYRDYYGE